MTILIELEKEEQDFFDEVIEDYIDENSYVDSYGNTSFSTGASLGLVQKKRQISSSVYAYLNADELLDDGIDEYEDYADAKLIKLQEIIREVCSKNGKKLIVFAIFKKTLKYLNIRLSKAGIGSIIIHGGIQGRYDEIQKFKNDPSINVLLSSEVGGEGLDMQFCDALVNYDLPWNPMRIVQRHGRVDRIGSKHDTVQMGLFFPSAHLDELLRLEETLERKLAQAEAAVGAGVVLPGREPGNQVIFADTKEQIDQLYNENPELLESRGSSAALSGEEYRRRLSNEMKDPFTRHDVENLPYGSGSGFENPRIRTNGYVFCVKIGAHEKPWFRFVPVDENWDVKEKG
jgi:hypothetical protein